MISSMVGTILWSDDLVHWQLAPNEAFGGFSKIVYGNGAFLGLPGERNLVYFGPYRSKDGIVWWQQALERGHQSFTGGAIASNGAVIVGGQYPGNPPSILHSENMTNWTSRMIQRVPGYSNLKYSGDRFFLQGVLDGLGFWQSETGVEWRFSPGPGTGDFSLPAFGAGRFVSVGFGGACAVSSNGLNWTLFETGVT